MRNSLDPLAWLDCTTTQRESSTGKVTAPTVGQRVNLCGTLPKGVLHVLNRPGVSVTWDRGELHFHVAPEALTKAELTLLLGHKEEVGGWLLLHKLLEAGYSLRLQPSEYGPGYVLIPTNPPTPRRTGGKRSCGNGRQGGRGNGRQGGDFQALFELYDTFHDSAVALLLDACRLLKINPVDWPKAAERFVREAVLHVQERELA